VDSQDDEELAALVHSLERYLDAKGFLTAAPPSPIEIKVASYATYLGQVRGLAPSTISQHEATAAEFLAHLAYERQPTCLTELTARDLEGFVRVVGTRISRASLQHVVAHLRGFLRFLASAGETQPGLDSQIDTPRLYRGERLPRALPWETVRTFLASIDRTKSLGLRDYAIFLLITTYGLRSCEVVALSLDDIRWRTERIRIPQRKTGGSLCVPLTDEGGGALLR